MTEREQWVNVGRVVAALAVLLALFMPAAASVWSWAMTRAGLNQVSSGLAEMKAEQKEMTKELRNQRDLLIEGSHKSESRFLDIERRVGVLEAAVRPPEPR